MSGADVRDFEHILDRAMEIISGEESRVELNASLSDGKVVIVLQTASPDGAEAAFTYGLPKPNPPKEPAGGE